MANLFARKPLDRLMAEAQEVGEHSLKRSLGPINLIALGIGGIIGAGLFVRTAAAIADRAGPSVVLAFIVAGIGCAFAGLCYAEFASMIPVAGSAYTYSYATMGELVAWIIGVNGFDRLERVRESRARVVRNAHSLPVDPFSF
jgi:basic amino acid/polyamine antiporter, APA family